MSVFYIIPSFNNGGDEASRFVVATDAKEAIKLASADVDDFPREFEYVPTVTARNADRHWRCYDVSAGADPIIKRGMNDTIPWDTMNPTYWLADDE